MDQMNQKTAVSRYWIKNAFSILCPFLQSLHALKMSLIARQRGRVGVIAFPRQRSVTGRDSVRMEQMKLLLLGVVSCVVNCVSVDLHVCFLSDPVPCANNEFQCKNLECIKASFFCDGAPDCLDGTDEPDWCGTCPTCTW